MKTFLSIAFLFFLTGVANAGTIIVVHGESTIQDGIDASTDGDTVLVNDGTYTGSGNVDLSLDGKEIVVKSLNGPSDCIINGEGTEFFGFADGMSYEGLNSTIEGFTIRNFIGLGIYYYADGCPSVKNNVVEWCAGGGIAFYGGSAMIENNTVQNNGGFGIECSSSSAVISGNTIRNNNDDNGSGAGITLYSASATIVNNIISDNNSGVAGGGIYAKKDSSVIINNTIVRNSSRFGAGIFATESNQTLINNIVAFSETFLAPEGYKLDDWREGDVAVTYSYSGGILAGATFHEGFVNKGAPCNVTIRVNGDTESDTTIMAESYECYSMIVSCSVQSGGSGSINFTVFSDTDTINITSSIGVGGYGIAGIGSLNLTSYGIDAIPAGLVTDDCDTTVIWNSCFYGNDGGGYFKAENASSEIDLSGVCDNITTDPLLDGDGYSLSEGSPCIDQGIADTSGLNLPSADIFGESRIMDGNNDEIAVIDIGAIEYLYSAISDNNNNISDPEFFKVYPNPFNYTTTLEFSIQDNGFVTVDVVDLRGRKVSVIVEDNLLAGSYSFIFDGSGLPGGVYIVKVIQDRVVNVRKLVVSK